MQRGGPPGLMVPARRLDDTRWSRPASDVAAVELPPHAPPSATAKSPIVSARGNDIAASYGATMSNDNLDAAMAGFVARGDIPGIVTLVARGDEVLVDAVGTTTAGGSCGSTTRSIAGCRSWRTAGC